MEQRQFKVLKSYGSELNSYPTSIPWDMLNEEQAKVNHSQTLNRLNERGGMTVLEILNNIRRRDIFTVRECQADVEELNRLISEHNALNAM